MVVARGGWCDKLMLTGKGWELLCVLVVDEYKTIASGWIIYNETGYTDSDENCNMTSAISTESTSHFLIE